MKSQADCYRALLDGKTLVSEKYECEVTLNKRGMLEDNKGEGRYFIFCGEYDWEIKEELPQPKKLYAYRNSRDDTERWFSTCYNIEGKEHLRCPEFDLEYPNE